MINLRKFCLSKCDKIERTARSSPYHKAIDAIAQNPESAIGCQFYDKMTDL
jgi:hypothetical protein